jgi:hypothetical protein
MICMNSDDIHQPDSSDPFDPEPADNDLPRWIEIASGILLALFTLLCAFAASSLLLVPNKKVPLLALVVGFLLLLGCLWVLAKCFRLITGRKTHGGLLMPTALRVVSVFLLIFPVAGLFTSYYRAMGPVAIFQAVMYISGFFGLRALARKREMEESRTNTSHDS